MLYDPKWEAKATPKLDPAAKALWTAALRSGEYSQGAGWFEQNGRFCALGVFCKALGQPTEVANGTNWYFVDSHMSDRTIRQVYNLNDAGVSFPQIADWIEANL